MNTWGRQKSNCKGLEMGTRLRCLRNSKATSMAGAELQELLQSFAGHCKDYGFTECSGSHWRAVIGSEVTLNRYALMAMIRDWQEGKNGSKTGNRVSWPVPQGHLCTNKEKNSINSAIIWNCQLWTEYCEIILIKYLIRHTTNKIMEKKLWSPSAKKLLNINMFFFLIRKRQRDGGS